MPDPSNSQPSATPAPQSPSRLRRFAHGAIVLIAAIGSIATSPARWHVTAPLSAKASSGKGQLITVEASAEPHVNVGNGTLNRSLRPEGKAGAWTGRANYFVPPSETLSSVDIEGTCSGGFCSKCEPPPGAFARIVSSVEVEPWILDATYAPVKVDLIASEASATFRVVVAATRPPTLTVKQAAPFGGGFFASENYGNPYTDPKDDPQTATKRYAFSVSWYRDSKAPAGPISGVWTPIVTIAGYCQEAGPCVAPNSEGVAILSIDGPPSAAATTASANPGAAPVGSAGP